MFVPNGAAPFSAPAERGTRTALACSPFPGGSFFAEPQRGDSPSADGGDVAAPAAGAKRKGHLRFPFLFELLPFPCWDSLGADGRLRKQEKDAAVGLPQRVFLRLFAVHRQITATHTGYFPQARHTRAAQLVSLEFADSTYGLGVRCNLSSQALSIITR